MSAKVSKTRNLYIPKRQTPIHSNILLQGLKTLREDSVLIDITICIGRYKYNAHKVVLSACSDYFRAMFNKTMIEGNNDTVTLYDISPMAFNLLLNYTYTSQLELTDENVQDVLEAAVYLQIPHVINMCSEYLEEHLNEDNYVEIVKIAEALALRELKIAAYRYICDNLSVIAKLDQFRCLSPDHIENILKFDLPVDCSEADLLYFMLGWFFSNNISNFSISKRIRCLPTILRQIKYERIPKSALDDILFEKLYKEYYCESYNVPLYTAVVEYILRLPQIGTSLSCSTFNCRGMEIALVKIGGIGKAGITNEINCCFHNNRQWNYLTKIPHVDQSNFATAVLNNNLYVIGGCYNQQLEEIVHPYGFKYNPRLDVWTEVAAMRTDRCRFTLNACDGKLYAIGGVVEFNYVAEYTSTCECLDPDTDTWEFISPLPDYKSQHAAVSLSIDGVSRLYVSGGINGEDVSDNMYYFDTKKQRWQICSPLLTPRADHFMYAFDKKIYVCGGWYANYHRHIIQVTVDAYDCLSDTWEVVTEIPVARAHAGFTAHDGKIYIVGGFTEYPSSHKNFAAVDCYDISTNKWTSDDKNVQEYWEHTCATLYIPKSIDSSCTNPL